MKLCRQTARWHALELSRCFTGLRLVIEGVVHMQVVNPLCGSSHQAMQEEDVLDQEPSNAQYSSNSLGHSALLNERRVTKKDMQPSAAQADELPPCRSYLVL